MPSAVETSLGTKLQNAAAAIAAGTSEDITTACNNLGAFINQVQAQSGKKITVSQANQLIAAARQIQAVLGCP